MTVNGDVMRLLYRRLALTLGVLLLLASIAVLAGHAESGKAGRKPPQSAPGIHP